MQCSETYEKCSSSSSFYKKFSLFVAHFKRESVCVWLATATAQTSEIASFALQNGLWWVSFLRHHNAIY